MFFERDSFSSINSYFIMTFLIVVSGFRFNDLTSVGDEGSEVKREVK